MTVASETYRVSYAGNGSSTAFAVPFPFLANSHLQVIEVAADGTETTKTITTHYTVSGAGGASGTVTMVTAPATGVTLVIRRNVPLTQETDYVENDPFPAATHEQALDKLTMIAQQQDDRIERAFRLSDGDTSSASTLIPTPEASKVIGWNEDGDELVNYSASELAALSATGTMVVDVFSGDGAETAFTMSTNPGTKNNTDVFVGGVYQQKSTYSVSGTTLTFSVAPALGTNNIEVKQLSVVDGGIGTPSDGSVTTDSLAAGLLVPVAKGGTGKSSNTAGTLLLGAGASAMTELAFGAARQVAISTGSAWGARALVGADLPDGTVVGRAYAETTTATTAATTIPIDDTIPQNTEGTEILTAAITPASATNRVRVRAVVPFAADSNVLVLALFQDSVANALAANTAAGSDPANSLSGTGILEFEHCPATTSAVTYKIRVGSSSGDWTVNGEENAAGGRLFGGVSRATLVLEEIKAS